MNKSKKMDLTGPFKVAKIEKYTVRCKRNDKNQVLFDYKNIEAMLRKEGVVVIENVFTIKECHTFMQTVVKECLEELKILPQVKPGQYKDVICGHRTIMEYRYNEIFKSLFAYLYRNFH